MVPISWLLSHKQEMDIESLEAANQSLQADLKLAFKRIGDLQAAIEDEMESDDNEDLINRWKQMNNWLQGLEYFKTYWCLNWLTSAQSLQ